MIQVGDKLPGKVLMEYSDVEGEGCSIGPNPVDVTQGDGRENHCPVRATWRLYANLLREARAWLRRTSASV